MLQLFFLTLQLKNGTADLSDTSLEYYLDLGFSNNGSYYFYLTANSGYVARNSYSVFFNFTIGIAIFWQTFTFSVPFSWNDDITDIPYPAKVIWNSNNGSILDYQLDSKCGNNSEWIVPGFSSFSVHLSATNLVLNTTAPW